MEGRNVPQPQDEPTEIHVGVLLTEDMPAGSSEEGLDDGHVPAAGYRGRHLVGAGQRVCELGHEVLQATAEAVGHEVALVVGGVLAGIERRPLVSSDSFAIGDLELKFGVKATLGAGKAVQALLTATSEATVEVTVKLRQPPPDLTA
jgi:hypothetical protein